MDEYGRVDEGSGCLRSETESLLRRCMLYKHLLDLDVRSQTLRVLLLLDNEGIDSHVKG